MTTVSALVVKVAMEKPKHNTWVYGKCRESKAVLRFRVKVGGVSVSLKIEWSLMQVDSFLRNRVLPMEMHPVHVDYVEQ